MQSHIFLLQFLLSSAFAFALPATTKTSLNNTVEHGVDTECKTCPFVLCPNKLYYESDTNVTLTCFTEGTEIAGNSYAQQNGHANNTHGLPTNMSSQGVARHD
jgi:hypothetical protein